MHKIKLDDTWKKVNTTEDVLIIGGPFKLAYNGNAKPSASDTTIGAVMSGPLKAGKGVGVYIRALDRTTVDLFIGVMVADSTAPIAADAILS